MILISLALSFAPAAVTSSIDDDWARVRTCPLFAAFRSKWGERNRYSSYYAKTSKRLGCAPVQRPKPPTAPPRAENQRPRQGRRVTQPANRLKARVILDSSGSGDVTTLSAAIELVEAGGVIEIRPGTYEGGIGIYKSVVLRGIPDSVGTRPLIRSISSQPAFTVGGGTISLESLNFQAQVAHANALYVYGGSVKATHIRFQWNGEKGGSKGDSDATVFVSRAGTAEFKDVSIDSGYSQALAIYGGTVSLTESNVSNAGGTGIFVPAGSLTMSHVTIENTVNPILLQGLSRATLSYILIRDADYKHQYPIYAAENSVVSIDHSVICLASGYAWRPADQNSRITANGVFNALGTMVDYTATPGNFADQAKKICVGHY